MLTRLIGFFGRRGKQLAGVDKAGNTYFREPQSSDGTVVERRWVEIRKSSNTEPIPVEWHSWLNGRRKEAPTPEEMMELESRRNAIKVKAALLEAEEEKRQYRAKALQQGLHQDDVSPHTMTRFLQQVTGGDVLVPGEAGTPVQHEASGQIFKTETCTSSQNIAKSAEPQGAGDLFKPGTWKP